MGIRTRAGVADAFGVDRCKCMHDHTHAGTPVHLSVVPLSNQR